ncbi:39S ribosomal protein L51, mitochondrial-like protein [Euroglyphus maynei]|uniref:Large ribosomal subunit protein mL51 n=1 Tax=Euroglyphus maynei TaxID=6958 RepID=A0A1Y3BJ32_EURMA|nr:39S ribosomal protein L51, mitochondrial-like protein [Euroglyphus maynei]
MKFGLHFLKTFVTNNVSNSHYTNQIVSSPLLTIVRFYERRRFIRRYGYRPHYHSKGLLPRIRNEPFPLKEIPNEKKPDPWRQQAAMFGQNDYIDILGDGKINPTDIMSSIPSWLQRFRGNEMQMLIRRRKAKAHWKWFRPQKWIDLNKRIDFLYKRLNYKRPPRPPEY